jgi:SET domain-containing protein
MNLLNCKKMINNPQESEEEIKERLYHSSPISLVEYNIQAIEKLTSYAGFKKIYLESAWRAPTNFPNSHKAMLYRMRRYAAETFVTHGCSAKYFWKLIS